MGLVHQPTNAIALAAVAALALVAGCRGRAPAPSKSASHATIALDAGAVAQAAPPTPHHGKIVADETANDASSTDADLLRHGAMPAWQAVISRSELLARRGQHGVIFGRVGAAVPGVVATPPLVPGKTTTSPPAPVPRGDDPPLIWLVDDSEGGGSLGVRVAFRGVPPPAGSRVSVGGAWMIDSGRRWYWRADSLSTLPAQGSADPAPATNPSHAIATAEMPVGAHPVSIAKDDDVITFKVVGIPGHDGDGWLIADKVGDPPVALLTLPGERATFGGDDLRQSDEHWTLRKGDSYWVRIGKVRHRIADAQEIINARGAPSKF